MDIELADSVAAIRDELLVAASRATGAGVEFLVGSIELEFNVELKTDAKAKAGFKAWVVSADAEAGASRTRKHRVSVQLIPRQAGGGDLLVAGDHDRPAEPGDLTGHIGR
ncbi:trypco2 family protein [Streptomyces sp. NPDC001002]